MVLLYTKMATRVKRHFFLLDLLVFLIILVWHLHTPVDSLHTQRTGSCTLGIVLYSSFQLNASFTLAADKGLCNVYVVLYLSF